MTSPETDDASEPSEPGPGRLYHLRSVLDKQPVAISGVVMQGVNVSVAAGWWHPTAVLLSALNVFVVGFLGLFIVNKTANKRVLNEMMTTPTDPAAGT